MKLRKVYIPLCFLLMGQAIAGNCQDFMADFKKINAVYRDSSYRMELSYNYYNELQSQKPDQTVKAEVRKSDNQYYIDIHNTQTIINKGLYLQVNHELKVIILDSAKPSYYQVLGLNLDSLTRFYKGVEYKAIDSLTGQYIIPSNSPSIAYTRVVFDRKTYLLKEITIQFLDARKSAKKNTLRNRLHIRYMRMDMSPHFDAQSFSQNAFIYKKGNDIKVKKPYSTYRLVSNL